jgi:ATP-dependent protease ClpP protease subunit
MKQGIFMRSMEADATEAVIDIVGVIGWEVWYQTMRDMLKAIPQSVKRVCFDIYSPGGDVWEGNGIVQEIGELSKRCETVARVQMAASMATLIAVACDKRNIAQNGRFLIHNAWAGVQGDAAEMEKMAKSLRDCEQEAAKFYAERTGGKPEDMLALMAEERWMMPEETKALGFVHDITDPFKVEDFKQVRNEIEAAGKWPKALVDLPPVEETKTEVVNGTQTEPGAGVVAPVEQKPADKPADDAEYKRGYSDGITAGKAESEKAHAAELGKAAEQIESREKLIKAHQSAKDIAEGKAKEAQKQGDARAADLQKQIESLTQTLQEANDRLAKLLSGGLAFTPASVETWEEAMQVSNGDYEKAAKLDADRKLRDKYNREHRRK